MKYTLIFSYLLLISASTLAQPYAVAQLDHSPRHHEWIKLKSNGRDLSCFVTYPESSKSALVILLIHENRGLNDWARSMADQLSEAGYVVVAPDLISGMSSEYEKTMDYPNSDQARTAIYGLKQSEVLNDLDAVFAYAENIPAGTGQVAVMGFAGGDLKLLPMPHTTNVYLPAWFSMEQGLKMKVAMKVLRRLSTVFMVGLINESMRHSPLQRPL